jgi:SsrA-binding protein
MKKDRGDGVIAENRKAGFDYEFLETFEAGLVLLGTEVKAIREGGVNLRDSFCRLQNGEAYLLNAHIGQYSHGGSASHDPLRTRKLLLHREELNKLLGKTTSKGLTIVPLRLFYKNGRVKVAIALAKGKRTIDKRETTSARRSSGARRCARRARPSRRGGYNHRDDPLGDA